MGPQWAEALLACNVLNQMTDLGRPAQRRSVKGLRVGIAAGQFPIHAPTHEKAANGGKIRSVRKLR